MSKIRGVGRGMPSGREPVRPANISPEEWGKRFERMDMQNYAESGVREVKSRGGKTVYKYQGGSSGR